MKTKIFVILLTINLLFLSTGMFSQTNVLYFMENVPSRMDVNPAFIPTQKVYIILPADIYTGLHSNSFAPNDFIKSVNGEYATPFSDNGDKTAFLNALKPENLIHSDTKIDILGLGLKVGKSYVTMGLSQRTITSLSVPYDLPWLLLNGLPNTTATKNLDCKSLGADISLFAQPSVSYSQEIIPNLTAGAKVKFLLGQAHGNISFNKLSLQGNYASSVFSGLGTLNTFTPFPIPLNEDGIPDFESLKIGPSSFYTFCGSGMAFDFGVVYKPIENLTLSASVTDLGSIKWKKNNLTGKMNAQINFENTSFKIGDDYSDTSFSDSIQAAFTFTNENTSKTTSLTTHTRLGAEYGILNNKISVGLLYDYRKNIYYSEGILTGSVNFRPFHSFNATLAYSQLNAKLGTLGLGLNVDLGPFTIFLMSDYIPISLADKYIPKTNHINIQTGAILVF